MNEETVQAFLRGALCMGSAVIALFFRKYWRATGDRLFGFFFVAFGLLAAHWAALTIVDPPVETRHHLFWVRLAGTCQRV